MAVVRMPMSSPMARTNAGGGFEGIVVQVDLGGSAPGVVGVKAGAQVEVERRASLTGTEHTHFRTLEEKPRITTC